MYAGRGRSALEFMLNINAYSLLPHLLTFSTLVLFILTLMPILSTLSFHFAADV